MTTMVGVPSASNMTLLEEENELSIAAFYCQYFANQQQQQQEEKQDAVVAADGKDENNLVGYNNNDNNGDGNDNDNDNVYVFDDTNVDGDIDGNDSIENKIKSGNGGSGSGNGNDDGSAFGKDFWSDDYWTDEDFIKAEELLKLYEEKCSISELDYTSTSAIANASNASKRVVTKTTTEDGIAWNRFYSHNGTRFFKDRHYLHKAFPNEFGVEQDNRQKTLVEIGCGVGNAILPMLEQNINNNNNTNGTKDDEEGKRYNNDNHFQWNVIHGFDISSEAIDLMRQDPRFVYANQQQKAFGHVCDITKGPPEACINCADVATLIFCLSAIDPDQDMANAAKHVASILKPGGVLLFRDYGRFDAAQMKLGISRNKRLKENFYRKHDGTKCYYFTIEDLQKIFTSVGLQVLELNNLQRLYHNKDTGEKRRRVWVQGRFQKPLNAAC